MKWDKDKIIIFLVGVIILLIIIIIIMLGSGNTVLESQGGDVIVQLG